MRLMFVHFVILSVMCVGGTVRATPISNLVPAVPSGYTVVAYSCSTLKTMTDAYCAPKRPDTHKTKPNPRYFMEFGVLMHSRMEQSFGCDVKDVAFPGSLKRPDCVRARDCKIIEFKPNSASGRQRGLVQLQAYQSIVEAYYTRALRDGVVPEVELGGASILTALQDAGCVRAGKVHLTTELATYDRCRVDLACPVPAPERGAK